MSELSYAPAPTRPPSHCTTVKMLLSFVLRLPFVYLVGALRLPAMVALRLVALRTHGVPLGSGGPRWVRGREGRGCRDGAAAACNDGRDASSARESVEQQYYKKGSNQ